MTPEQLTVYMALTILSCIGVVVYCLYQANKDNNDNYDHWDNEEHF